MALEPYWSDDTCSLYLGDMREVLPALGVKADLVCTDPPYGETAHAWDRWPGGWVDTVAEVSTSLWCFGSMRMFLDHLPEFAVWKLSQDVIWEKNNGPGFTTDRFRRVHEFALHWYRGDWASVHHDTPRSEHFGSREKPRVRKSTQKHTYGDRGQSVWEDDGTRLMRSVIPVRSMHGRNLHPTEKPLGILDPLIRYACPTGGVVVDPFAGSGSTLEAARLLGRRAIGVEGNEAYAEKAALRLSQAPLDLFSEVDGDL